MSYVFRGHHDCRNSGQYQVIRKGVGDRVLGVCAMRHVPSAESPELRAINREQIAAGRKQGANSKAQRPETADRGLEIEDC